MQLRRRQITSHVKLMAQWPHDRVVTVFRRRVVGRKTIDIDGRRQYRGLLLQLTSRADNIGESQSRRFDHQQ